MSKPQHYEIFLPDLLNHYRDGDLTAKGALKIYFRLRLKEGWKCKIKPAQIRGFFSKWSDKHGEMKEMNRMTFWRAMHELQEEGEIDFKEPESLIVRLFNRPDQPLSQINDERNELVTGVTNLLQVSQICDEDELEDLQGNGSSFSSDSSQISFKSSQCIEQNFEIFENTHTEILENSEEEDLPGNVLSIKKHWENQIELSDQSKICTKDQFSGGATATIKYDSRLGMRPPAPKPKFLIPDGDWLNPQGQLDDQFLTSIAKQWMKSSNASFHQMPIEEVKGLVFSHFAKDHNALAIKWEAYCAVETRHAVSTKLAIDAGISIPLEQQQRVINATGAIASSNTYHQDSVFTISNQLTVGSEHTENHGAYRLIEAAPIDEQEQIENLKRLASLSSVIGRMPEGKANVRRANIRRLEITPADINEANQWILDPTLRMAALQWAKNQGFNFDGTEIYEEEF
ncbi:hypothetical protein [Planktothrix agardhii]|uniref:hypothetical protein n=1 Tax=Planktothrix agardhii TaxID=1160 RepID=UPI0003F68B3A|nr:hypothetical protein [Planktothrix agardhii]